MLKTLIIILVITLSKIMTASAEKKLITINQFIVHPALDKVTQGMIKALEESKLLPDITEIKTANSQGSMSVSAQVSSHQLSMSPYMMIGIATPAAQSLLSARSKVGKENIMIGFAAVSDPEAAGLTDSQSIIGVTDNPPVEELIDNSMQILPNLKNLGVIYNLGEVSSVEIVQQLDRITQNHNIKLFKSIINSSSDAKAAVIELLNHKVDAIYVPLDNIAVSAINSIVNEASKNLVPVISNDPALINSGVLIALGCNYYDSGKQLGFMIADIIQKKTIADKIQKPNIRELKINKEVASALKINIPSQFDQFHNSLTNSK